MDNSIVLTQNTTVTAQYNVNTYTVRINPNGASGSTKTYTVTYGQRWNVPSCPFSRTGYTFSGYSGGYRVGQSITITGNISISCNWTKIPTVNDLSNPTVSSKGTNKYWVEKYEGSGTSGYFNLTISATISFGMALPSGSSVIVTVDCSSCSKGSYSYTLPSVSGTNIVLNKTVKETNRVVSDSYGWGSYPINKITVKVTFGGSSRSFQVSL